MGNAILPPILKYCNQILSFEVGDATTIVLFLAWIFYFGVQEIVS
jgi:hypothetical protein